MKTETIFCDRCKRDLTQEYHEEVQINGEKQLCLPCKEALSVFMKEKDTSKFAFEHKSHARGEWMIIEGMILAVFLFENAIFILRGGCL